MVSKQLLGKTCRNWEQEPHKQKGEKEGSQGRVLNVRKSFRDEQL